MHVHYFTAPFAQVAGWSLAAGRPWKPNSYINVSRETFEKYYLKALPDC
jgi:hypothetical protein